MYCLNTVANISFFFLIKFQKNILKSKGRRKKERKLFVSENKDDASDTDVKYNVKLEQPTMKRRIRKCRQKYQKKTSNILTSNSEIIESIDISYYIQESNIKNELSIENSKDTDEKEFQKSMVGFICLHSFLNMFYVFA